MAARTDQTVYTNFYYLQKHEFHGGMLIDRDQPVDSLLLELGLPDRHPGGVSAAFRDRDDFKYRLIRDWIRKLAKDPRYGIVPGAKPEEEKEKAEGRGPEQET